MGQQQGKKLIWTQTQNNNSFQKLFCDVLWENPWQGRSCSHCSVKHSPYLFQGKKPNTYSTYTVIQKDFIQEDTDCTVDTLLTVILN